MASGAASIRCSRRSLLIRELLFIFLAFAYIGQDTPVTGYPVPDDNRTCVKEYRHSPFQLVYQDILIKGDLPGTGQA